MISTQRDIAISTTPFKKEKTKETKQPKNDWESEKKEEEVVGDHRRPNRTRTSIKLIAKNTIE